MHVSDFKVVRVVVAGQTLREFFVYRRVVGCFPMAALTAWNLPMARVAEGASEFVMLGFAGL